MTPLQRLAATLAVVLAAAAPAHAQDFPTKEVHIISPTPPGGSDVMMRMMQEAMAASLGQPVVIENKPGAAGAIASREVARARPDGYTLLFTNIGPMTVVPVMQSDAGYDPVRSFAPVSLVARQPLVLIVNPRIAVNTLSDLIGFARAHPKELKYSSAGIGSFGHLSAELLAAAAGIQLVHVPYKGAAPSLTAVISGEASMSLTIPTGTMMQYVKDGKLKLLGVSTSGPSELAPGATPISSIIPAFGTAEYWFGIVAPANTNPTAVAKLNAAVSAALAKPGMAERFFDIGALNSPSTPEAFGTLIAAEVPRWRATIIDNKIQLN